MDKSVKKKKFLAFLIGYIIVCIGLNFNPRTTHFFYMFATIPIIILNFKVKKYKMGLIFIIFGVFITIISYVN